MTKSRNLSRSIYFGLSSLGLMAFPTVSFAQDSENAPYIPPAPVLHTQEAVLGTVFGVVVLFGVWYWYRKWQITKLSKH